MAAVVAHDALGLSGGAGRVEDVEGVGSRHRYTGVRLGGVHFGLPVEVPARRQIAGASLALQDNAALRLVPALLDRPIEQGLVVDYPARLDSAGCGDDDFGGGVVDAHRELIGSEAPENDGVHGAEACAGEHRDHPLRHHRHVDDDPIAPPHPVPGEHAREARDLVQELGVSEASRGAGEGGCRRSTRADPPVPIRHAGRARCSRCSFGRRRTSGRKGRGARRAPSPSARPSGWTPPPRPRTNRGRSGSGRAFQRSDPRQLPPGWLRFPASSYSFIIHCYKRKNSRGEK